MLLACDGEQALTTARTQMPDLILLDLVLPRRHGLQVLHDLKRDPTTSAIPVVVLSNLSQESDIRECRHRGAAAFLVKSSLSLRELADTVSAALAEKVLQ